VCFLWPELRLVCQPCLFERGLGCLVFAGDSPNDGPMFGHFPHGVGVANVLDFADRLHHKPRWVTRGRGSQGFVELAEALLAARPA